MTAVTDETNMTIETSVTFETIVTVVPAVTVETDVTVEMMYLIVQDDFPLYLVKHLRVTAKWSDQDFFKRGTKKGSLSVRLNAVIRITEAGYRVCGCSLL